MSKKNLSTLLSRIRHASVGVLLIALTAPRAWAQAYSITQPEITTCVGALLDSGGEGASGYGNNEDFTTTLCSGQPGQSISLNWITFNLSTTGPDPVDQLSIYDGPDANAPLIGTYVGTNSPGIVSASFANTSGCLTLHFTSNGAGTGVFAATILCYVPCEPPTAVAVMGEAAPALICQGEVVDFNATGSFAAAGHTIVDWHWNFDDGSEDMTSGPTVSHAFTEPGEYVVQLTLTDDNACENTNLIDLAVRVSTTPTFALGPDQQVCLGEEVQLTGNVTPTTWNDLPNSNLGDGLFLPDNVGETFTTELDFGVFEPGAILTDIDQLESFCVSMEHSFIGDLVIQLVCPTGQSVIVHQQDGGGTFLGIPVDEDTQPNAQGTCWDYCWSPSATNGTWAENGTGGTLPSGTYESVYPMSALQGCALNGTWTLNITDLWASDNGFVCDWSLNFDPSLYPDLTSYTPVLGTSTPDSAAWSGNGVVQDPNTPTIATVTPMAPGSNAYTFSVTDNFGCTYSDVVNVSASGPLAVIGANPGSPQPIGATVYFTDASLANGNTITGWLWDFGPTIPASTLQNPAVIFTEPGSYTVTLTITSAEGCTSTTSIDYEVVPTDVIIPNVFSPNNDGSNDALEFGNAQFFNNNHLEVYSRWGNLVYESSNYRNTWRPTDVSEGTYFFIFRMQDGREWTGHVTLLR